MAARLKKTRASDVRPVRAKYIDDGRIRLHVANVLAGDVGLGKSTEAARIARIFTESGDRVLVVVGEDSVDDTLRPRYEAAGCDLDLVEFVEVVEDKDGEARPLTLPQDTAIVAAEFNRTDGPRVGLVIVDPVMAHLDERFNAFNEQQARRAMTPLVNAASAAHVTLLLLMHTKKGAGTALERIGGAKALGSGLGRSVLVLMEDEENGGRAGDNRLVAHVKANGSRLQPLRRLRIEEVVVPDPGNPRDPIPTTRTVVEGDDERDGLDLAASPELRQASGRSAPTPTRKGEAGDWLLERLESGPANWADELVPRAKAAGHAEATLRSARDALKRGGLIDKRRLGSGHYIWELVPAEGDSKDNNHDNHNNLSKLEVEQVAEVVDLAVVVPLASVEDDDDGEACRHARERDGNGGWHCLFCGEPMEAA